jgi:hypothetical protein
MIYHAMWTWRNAKGAVMTIREAKAICRSLGFSLNSRPADGEYRLCEYGAGEVRAYYTTDLDDAVCTARKEAGSAS